MARQAEVLGRAVEASGEVSRLEDALNRNLATLAGAKHFEQTVLGLAATINLLNARLAERPRRRADRAAGSPAKERSGGMKLALCCNTDVGGGGTPSVSLFPFLAVLICTMGALVLLLFVVTRQARQQALREAAAKHAEAARRSQGRLRNGPMADRRN